MNCVHFREQYSEFADGFLDEADEIAMLVHRSECETCKRFDAAYRAGANTLRGLPDLEVSEGFHDRLQARILIACSTPEPVATGWRRWPAGMLVLVGMLSVAGWQFADHRLPGGRVAAANFVVRFGDTSLTWPGRVPMIPVSRDSSRLAAPEGAQLQIAVDHMVVR